MKILEIIDTLQSGGGERFVVDLCNEMSKTEEVILLTLRTNDTNDFYRNQLNINVKQIIYNGSGSLINRLYQMWITLVVISKNRPDIVHVHLQGFIYSILPRLFFPKIKYFYTVHNVADKDASKGIVQRLRRIFLKSKIKAIAISKACGDSFIHFYGYKPYKVIYNGCRILSISKNFFSVREEIDRLKIDNKTKVFITVARIQPQKNQRLLIESFNQIINEGNNAILLIVGDWVGYNSLYEELVDIANERVHFLGTRTNVADYLALSDFFCLSSLWEGLPISLLEAGYMGCFPICTPVGGIVDVIKSDEQGILSNTVSIDDYKFAIKKALTFDIDRNKISNYYIKNYSISNTANIYLECFKGQIYENI